MKIRDVSSSGRAPSSRGGVKRKENASSAGYFREHLTVVTEINAVEKLSEMTEDIEKQGERIKKRADILELKRYKEMVADFLNEAVKYTFEFKKEETFDGRGRHRIYAVIKMVNQKMDDLTKEFLSEQRDNLKIMEVIDDIRGMLLDMMM